MEVLIVGIISGVSGLINALISANVSIKTAQIKQNNDILIYRIDLLEKKVDKTDALENDIIALKEQMKSLKEVIHT